VELALAGLAVVLLAFGLLALFAGAGPVWVSLHFVLAVALLAYAALRRPQRVVELLRGSGSRIGSNIALQTLALVVIFGLIAFLTARNPKNWDWTEAGLHTLAPGTLAVLEAIPAEPGVEILGFYVRGGERTPLGGEEDAKSLLEKYTYQTKNLKVAFHDPNARPDLAQRYEINTEQGVLLVCGGPCESAKGTVRVSEVSESELTKAIRSAISTRHKLYALAGHGEAGLADEKATGFSLAKSALENENYEVTELVLANQPDVPEDAEAVLVVGPDRSLFDTELDALDRFLKKGGGVAILSDPLLVSNLESRVRSWGIELGSDVVVEEQRTLFMGPQLGVQPIVSSYGTHPVTRGFGRERLTLFHLARSLRAADGVDGAAPVELALTGDRSWAESDTKRFVEQSVVSKDAGADRFGPLALAMATTVKGDSQEGRLIVVGDSDFARNRYLSEAFNADLFLNMVAWLVGEEEFATIERKLPRASSASITLEKFASFRFLSLFLLPELVVLAGVLVWWRRRSA
jgi:ABC-type uncharacterized transport system involved in gliding motility auxiliary subunit